MSSSASSSSASSSSASSSSVSSAPPGAEGLSHESLVSGQFGPKASAYVASTVHATGEDLLALAALAKASGGGAALDLGCGGGHVSFALAPHMAAVTAYDLADEMLAAVAAEAGRRGLAGIRTRGGAAEELPFADGAFDLVASRYSVHHWRDVRKGLAEARRVVKADGLAVFMDVVAPEDPLLDTFLQGIELLRDPSHVRNYTRSQWLRLAEEAGFRPGERASRRLRLEFQSWVTRIGTPQVHVAALKSLLAGASADVKRHFEIEPDGTFTLDTFTLELHPA